MRIVLVFLAIAWMVDAAQGQSELSIPDKDRIRIAEAFRLADAIGNEVWPDWDRAPFAVLLVTPEVEFLIRHPQPSSDFQLVGYDEWLDSKVWQRPRQFPTQFLATFPAIGGVSTVVIGQAENTEAKTSTPWIVTLLHEHFHQLQESQRDHFAQVTKLDLAGDDTTGMWMLNYPFPYSNLAVKDQFSIMSRALGLALQSRGTTEFDDALATYLRSRDVFRSLVSADEFRYFDFQLWKEGIARYTEYHLATLAAERYEPSVEFSQLDDFSSFQSLADRLVANIVRDLKSIELDQAQRVVVYNFGAAVGLLLDDVKSDWRNDYFQELSLDRFLKSAAGDE